jgi:hypothetical protein
MFATTPESRRFRVAATDDHGRPTQMSDNEILYFMETYGMKFAGFVFISLLHSGSKANRQLFFTNFALRYHGLSRFGIAIQAKLGVGLALTTMDRWQIKVRLEREDELR